MLEIDFLYGGIRFLGRDDLVREDHISSEYTDEDDSDKIDLEYDWEISWILPEVSDMYYYDPYEAKYHNQCEEIYSK